MKKFFILCAVLCIAAPSVYGFDLDELEQFEQLETLDLFNAATEAAKREDIGEAERLLDEAREKSSVRDGEDDARAAIKNAKERIAERKRQAEEKRRQEEERQRQAAASGGSYGPSRSDFYHACLGSTLYDSDCYRVDDPDLQKLCLARSERKDFHCYRIGSEDMKNLCLGISNSSYASNCYKISNDAMKDTCLAASSYRYTDRCYAISGGPWKLYCGGLALSSNNCYQLN